ncbi:hypothetical protein HYH03_013769 [Edaphochlamys debaryana]|uniref:ABC transporter domain-containing protein n=1 Tax=Edaphochlamys debaryana TaxID=47281 RepID=A0A836BSU8_9CHLO|nr:hypothetical protein HYH03_013769 [Edaphochlamys debaryana]|eukprot:KAG2487630.1 hypothetical protein HYH03_013769 [Edaphochlamys debaryana]
MADYKNAFSPEAQTLGVEGVFGIVPQAGAFHLGDLDLFARFSAHLAASDHGGGGGSGDGSFSRASTGIGRLAHAAASVLSGLGGPTYAGDERELVEEAVYQAAHGGRLRTLEELRELDKKVQAADKDLEQAGGFMLALAGIQRYYDVRLPSVTMRWRDLSVRTDALLGSSGLPSVGNSILSIFKRVVCMKEDTVDFAVLDNLSGVILPGRPTLLLGPPSSGKSSLLKLLSGRLKKEKTLRMSGDLSYNGFTQDEFVVERTTAYVNQHDEHIPTLTVMETLSFAHTCQIGSEGTGYDLPGELKRAVERAHAEGRDPPKDILGNMSEAAFLELADQTFDSGVRTLAAMRAMGIAHTADTPVGDAMLRGVSGGERKRVTTAEMLVGPRRVLLLDEISTGLDSATLYSICDLLCKACRAFNITMVVCLLQPPPEAYCLFDDVMLMSAGHVVFHGPVDQAVPFYRSLGFECPARKDAPSFLQEVATSSGQQELAGPELLSRHRQAAGPGPGAGPGAGPGPDGKAGDVVVPAASRWVIPPAQVVAAYWQTEAGTKMRALVDTPLDKAACPPYALVHSRYAMHPLQALRVVVARQFMLVLRDSVLIKGRIGQSIIMSLITGSLFYQLDNTVQDSRSYFSASFLGVMFMAMTAAPAIPVAMASKGVWYKHRAAFFYPAWCHALGANMAQIPVILVESAIYSITLYFMVGFVADAGRFFLFWLTLLSFSFCTNVLYRLIAYTCPNQVMANAFGGFTLLILILLSGFSIVRGSIPDYWIWAYYISPFAWALRCVVINEFTSSAWSGPATDGSGGTIGQQALATFDFYTTSDWYWGGIGYLWGLSLLLILGSTLSLAYLSGEPPVARVADPEELAASRRKAAEKAAAAKAKAAAAAVAAAATAPATAPLGADGGTAVADVSVTVDDAGKLPYTPITLVFQDLRYFVPHPSAGQKADDGSTVPPTLELLKGITGYSEPGSMTALMGGSGAGKTTLMDVIAGRKTVGEVKGAIWVNGHPKDQRSWARCAGYVEQMDLHSPATTVLEALLFSARLRLPASVSRVALRAYVDSVVSMVELDDVQFQLVGVPGGSAGSSLNVDARKRLTLAVELVANPAVVFMDEPTSGLDARAASVVMKAVRNVAADGRTIVVTIHQPSIEIFEAFDRLLLLQRGGRVTYFGPLGEHSKGLVDYLSGAVQGVEPLPPGYNPATWMLEVTGAAKAVKIKAVAGVDWPQVYQESDLARINEAAAQRLVEGSRAAHPQPLEVSGTYAAGLGVQLLELARKFRLTYWRTPSYNFVRLAITLAISLVYGSIYWDQGNIPNPAAIGNVQNVMGVIYSSTSFLGMLGMNSLMPLLGFERVVYYREQAAAMYSPWAYGFVLMFVETPYLLAQVLLFVGIIYPMIDFVNEAGAFFFYLFMVFLTLSFYLGFASALVYSTPSQQLAQVLGAGMNFLFNLFNGFVIPFPIMPVYYQWANRASPTTWVLYGLGAGMLSNNDTPMQVPGSTTMTTVRQFMETYFGFSYDFRLWCLLILVAYMIFFRTMGILALRYISFLRR